VKPVGAFFRGLRFGVGLGLWLGVAGGCAVTPAQRREETLVRTARQFNDDLRWSRYEQMTLSMRADDAQLFMGRANAVGEDLVIADYDVTSITFAPGSEKATVIVKLEWYKRQDPIVRSTTLEEKWELRDGIWLMTKQRRTRGDRFALTPEPVSTPPAP